MAVTKVYVDPTHTNRKNQQRIAQDELELQSLMGKTPEEAVEEDKEPEEKVVAEKTAPEVEPTDPEEKSFKKRYGDLRRHLSEKEKEWEEKIAALQTQSQKPQTVLPPKSDEDIAEWASKYPDIAAIVETIANKKADEKLSKYKNKFEEYEQLTYETARTKATNAIREAHSDFDELKKSDEFHQWADEQPKWVQDALYENEDDARSVIRVLDLYKVDKGLTTSGKKSKEKEAASFIAAKTKTNVDFDNSGDTFRESQVNKMSADEYSKKEAKIMEAIRKGNFIYDMTGGAR
jgi:hypothetical protein